MACLVIADALGVGQRDRLLATDERVLYVDLDAHQGNGHERDFLHDDRVHIIDMYNKLIYPNDTQAKGALNLGEAPRRTWDLNHNTYMGALGGA